MRELFEQKLKEFDLIIFDLYESGNLITRDYFRSIAEYLKGGGRIEVTRRTLANTFPQGTMTSPGTPPNGGATRTLDLHQSAPGLAVVDVDKPGLYGDRQRLVARGTLTPHPAGQL